MSEIKVGDLVMIIRPYSCCGEISTRAFIPFIAGHIVSGISSRCICGKLEEVDVICSNNIYPGTFCPLYVLKKIPPLNELEDQTEERKVEV